MSTNFLLANALSSLVNSRSAISYLPHSNFIFSLLEVLKSNGLLSENHIESNSNGIRMIKINKSSNVFGFFIKGIKFFSKPGRKIYSSIKDLKFLHNKDVLRFYLVSTSLGILKIDDAISNNVGGELICEVILN